MPRCFLATKSRPLKNVAAASRCSAAVAEPSAASAAGQNNRSTIGSISAAQAVQSIQEPVMLPRGSLRGVHQSPRHPQVEPKGSATRLLPSVPLPVEVLERPGGGGALPAASRHAMPPQPMPLVTTATLQVKQEEDCSGECNLKEFAELRNKACTGAPGKSLYVVARNFFLLVLNCSALPCLAVA